MEEKKDTNGTGNTISKELEKFVTTQEITQVMFENSRSMTNEEYEALQKTIKRTLSKTPTSLPRKK